MKNWQTRRNALNKRHHETRFERRVGTTAFAITGLLLVVFNQNILPTTQDNNAEITSTTPIDESIEGYVLSKDPPSPFR